MTRVRIGIVGLGSIAEYHLRAFVHVQEVLLQAVMSLEPRDVNRVAGEYSIGSAYLDYDQLLCDPEVDAIVLCTPNAMHYRMTRQALEANKHVLVEKPLTDDLQQLHQLSQLAQSRHLILMAAMTARFTPPYRHAYRLIKKAAIGDLIQITIRWFEKKTIGINWKHHPVAIDERSSTVLYHHGSHMLDAALWFANDTARTIHVIGNRRQKLLDDVAVTVKTMRGVLICSVHSFNASRKIHDLVVVGTEGMIEIEGYHRLTVNGQIMIDTDWEEGFRQGVDAQAKEFIDSICQQRSPIAAADDMAASYEVLERAYAQLKTEGCL